jgi:hypothetical protein
MNQILQDTVRQLDSPPSILLNAYLATMGESMYESHTLYEAMNSSTTHH